MHCREATRLFETHLDGTLDDLAAARFEAHLAGCAACRPAYALCAALRGRAAAEPAAPDTLAAAVADRVARYRGLGVYKLDYTIPSVRYYGFEDLSFFQRAQYLLTRRYWRRRAHALYGEYFPEKDAKRLLREVEALRRELAAARGSKVSFPEAADVFRATRYETWRAAHDRRRQDRDLRILAAWRQHRRAWAAAHPGLGWVPWLWPLAALAVAAGLFLALLPDRDPELRVLHTLEGEQALVLERACAGFSGRYRARVVPLRVEPAAFMSFYVDAGRAGSIARRAELLLLETRLLAPLAGRGLLAEAPYLSTEIGETDVSAPADPALPSLARLPLGSARPLWFEVRPAGAGGAEPARLAVTAAAVPAGAVHRREAVALAAWLAESGRVAAFAARGLFPVERRAAAAARAAGWSAPYDAAGRAVPWHQEVQ